MKSEKFRKILLISVLLAVVCLSANVLALETTRTITPNGLTVLHSENHNLPIVMVTLLVKAGQRHEPKEKAGLANLTAELLTEGTKNRTSMIISEEIDFIGASLDASAGNDFTTITLSVLKKDIDKGFELFSDILLNAVFPQAEIVRKREMIKGSLRHQEEDPSFLAGRAFKKEVFGEHPYGRLIQGSTDTLDAITKDDLTTFYSDFFLPNNAILSVAGDLTTDELDSVMKKYLGAWKKAGLPLISRADVEGRTTKRVIKVDRDLTQANIILGHLGISRDDPDYYAVSVMNYLLGGGGFSSRLMQSVRDKMGLAYDVHSFFSAYKEKGSFQIGVQTRNESANVALDEIFKQIERMRSEMVSDEEISDAKAYLTGSFPRRLDTSRKIADFFASAEFYGLGADYIAKYPAYINSVTKEEVLRVAKKYLDTKHYVLVVVANQKQTALKY